MSTHSARPSARKIKAALEVVLQAHGVHPDRIVAKKNGEFMVARGYFYHLGQTADGWGKRVEAALAGYGIVNDTRDMWRPFKGGGLDSELEAYVSVFAAEELVAAAKRVNAGYA